MRSINTIIARIKTPWGSFAIGVVVGIIANILTPSVVSLATTAAQSINANRLPWIFVFILIIFLIIVFFLWQRDKKRYSRLESAASMLFELPDLISQSDLNAGLHKMVYLILADTAESFPFNIRRGALLLPDAQEEYLTIFAQCGAVREQNVDEIKFYIGDDKNRQHERGMAGIVYKETKEPCISYFQTEKDLNQAINNGFRVLDFEQQGRGSAHPPYNSLICVPVLGKGGVSLGVVCFDSKQRNDFNSRDSRDTLITHAKYIATALMIKDGLQTLREELRNASDSVST